MPTFNVWEVLIVLGVAAWFGFSFGKFYGRGIERKAERLHSMAEKETDPDKKQKLLLEWNDLGEDKKLRDAFREALLLGKNRKKNS